MQYKCDIIHEQLLTLAVSSIEKKKKKNCPGLTFNIKIVSGFYTQ